MTHLEKKLVELVGFTQDCRPDMHEPDEQGLTARILNVSRVYLDGDRATNVAEGSFDNAMGEDVGLVRTYGASHVLHQSGNELVVELVRDDDAAVLPGGTFQINLATLVALARRATESESREKREAQAVIVLNAMELIGGTNGKDFPARLGKLVKACETLAKVNAAEEVLR